MLGVPAVDGGFSSWAKFAATTAHDGELLRVALSPPRRLPAGKFGV
ncbi:MAG: hypothetical protein ACYCX9_07885 [Candidatus Dormibacteria bacterium]|jgi:hypothetical protein